MSGVKRFFAENIAVGGECALTGEEYEHAVKVLRLSVGDEAVLLDNGGKEYAAVVAAVNKKEMVFHVLSSREGDKEAKTEIALYFGFLKNADKNEFAVQKAVELGVKRIALFSSDYSSAYLSENKTERLKKVAREAAKQCMRSSYPEIVCFSSLGEALKDAERYRVKFFACEFAKKSDEPLSSFNGERLSGGAAVFIGSEGGFSSREAALARESGCTFVSLGKRILRAETAAVALLSVVAFQAGEWQ
ncbi:MAG: RsmE family RNA methyltransferase [Candidatus Scatosoma sp.]